MKWTIEHHKSLRSTQDYLSDSVLKNTLDTGFLVQADHQSSGKGRHGRVWVEADGNLYFSFLIKDQFSLNHIGQISLLCGVAVAQTIEKVIGTRAEIRLKWPNDININNQKCCGILINSAQIHDNIIDYFIIGIGINTNSAPFEYTSSLQDHSDKQVHKIDVLNCFTNIFSNLYNDWDINGFANMKEQWLRYSYPKGTIVSVKNSDTLISGEFETVDNIGNLVITCNQTKKRRIISAGDVFIEG